MSFMESDRISPSGPPWLCISLIGMAGAGKSTVGRQLARLLGWKLLDTDQLIESVYGLPLQEITDSMGKEAFLDAEGIVAASIRARRVVLATGGSVIYREDAMIHLRSLGPVAYLDVPLPLILERIARNPQRGLAIAPGQTIGELFREREALYVRYADCAVKAEGLSPADCAKEILERVRAMYPAALRHTA